MLVLAATETTERSYFLDLVTKKVIGWLRTVQDTGKFPPYVQHRLATDHHSSVQYYADLSKILGEDFLRKVEKFKGSGALRNVELCAGMSIGSKDDPEMSGGARMSFQTLAFWKQPRLVVPFLVLRAGAFVMPPPGYWGDFEAIRKSFPHELQHLVDHYLGVDKNAPALERASLDDVPEQPREKYFATPTEVRGFTVQLLSFVRASLPNLTKTPRQLIADSNGSLSVSAAKDLAEKHAQTLSTMFSSPSALAGAVFEEIHAKARNRTWLIVPTSHDSSMKSLLLNLRAYKQNHEYVYGELKSLWADLKNQYSPVRALP